MSTDLTPLLNPTLTAINKVFNLIEDIIEGIYESDIKDQAAENQWQIWNNVDNLIK